MNYLIEGLDPAKFAPLFQLSDAELAERNIIAINATNGASPCRVSLHEAAEGDRLLLLNNTHQPATSPYHSMHAIYVAQGSTRPGIYRGCVPPIMQTRILSIRAFDGHGTIIDADVVDGSEADPVITAKSSIACSIYSALFTNLAQGAIGLGDCRPVRSGSCGWERLANSAGRLFAGS